MSRDSKPDSSPDPTRAPGAAPLTEDHRLLHPDDIVLSGPYVRQHVDEEELASLTESILAGGEIKQAIGVRVEGPEEAPSYVLVYGMRRWLASKRAGLDRIPVRDHGRISVVEALALQVAENEARVDPHPVDTAVSYQMLVQEGGMSQAEVARIAGRSPAHVSYMRAVGEAILALTDEERAALYRTPEATVPRFQRIAPLKTVEERAEALRSLLYEAGPATKRELKGIAQVRAGVSKKTGAWTVRLSYRDEDLRTDPELAARLERFLEDQLRRVRRLRPAPQQRQPVTWEIESG
ncbi:MAG TPA: ParB/RepB/Spo0J family partition protein [Longimicrobiaceae bacterium]